MLKPSTKYVSVFIPTFNGEKYLGECIEAIIHQELPVNYELELLITDSGSSDKSLEIIEKYGQHVHLLEIPNSEFKHGKVRQDAAERARGEFILFLTQDATPTNSRWLINMMEPFFLSEKVGCVFGRQIPRPFVAPTIKREVATVFGSIGSEDSIIIHRNSSLVDTKETNPINSFFSDANSAARRSLLTGDVPFRDIHYSEDQALAEDMQKAGYLKAYAPQGAVWHSNEYTAKEYFQRKFDEFIGLNRSTGYELRASRRSLLFEWIRPTLEDWKFILRDNDYSKKSKLKWLVLAPFYNFGNKAGYYFAAKKQHDKKAIDKLSLEAKLRK